MNETEFEALAGAALQRIEQPVARIDLQLDSHQRELSCDVRYGTWNEADCRSGNRPDVHLACLARFQQADFVCRLAETRKGDAGMANDGFSVPVRADSSRQPLEELRSDDLFEIAQQAGSRGLRHVQHLRGSVNVTLLADRRQKQQMPRSQSRANEPRL